MNFDRVCIDASLALAWLIPWQYNQDADGLRRLWFENAVEMIAPQMFRAEVTSVLREEVFFQRLSPEEGEEAFSLYSSVPVRIVDGPAVYRRAWELAGEYNQRRTYDMLYLAAAELEDCEFWTADKKLVNSIRGKTDRVKFVTDTTGWGT